MRPFLVLLLFPLAACDRQLDVEQLGALALGQNLYRSGELDVQGPPFAARAAQAHFARWSTSPQGLDVRWVVSMPGTEPASSPAANLTSAPRPAAGRMLLSDFASLSPLWLPSAAAIEQRDEQLFVQSFHAPAHECCLVLVCLDPDRRGLPLTVVASASPQRLLAALPNVRPGWKREALILRLGRPWLLLDLEAGGDEWVLIDESAYQTSPEGEAGQADSDSAYENYFGRNLVNHGNLAPGILGIATKGVDVGELKAYGRDCEAALQRAASLVEVSEGSWTIQALATVPLQGWPAELAFADLPSRTLFVLLPSGIATDKGRNFARALLFAGRPDASESWLDAHSAWCARLHQTPRLGILADHPERPSVQELITDGAALRHSPYLMRPLRAQLIEWSRRQGCDPWAETPQLEVGPGDGDPGDYRAPWAESLQFEDHLSQLPQSQRSIPVFEARPRGAFLRPAAQPGSLQAFRALGNLAEAGATSIALAYDLCFDPDPGQGRAWQPARALGSLSGDASWLVACAQARSLGLEVQLWPTVLASHSSVPSTRLVRVMSSQQSQLFDQLAASTTHAALMAAASGAQVVSLGYDLGHSLATRLDPNQEDPSEWLTQVRRAQEEGWARAIQAARASFEGAVVISCEDVRRFDQFHIWSQVDALAGGLFPVLEGTDQGQIPLRRLKELFVERLAPVKARADELGLPLWIAPSGFRPTLTAARGPGADGVSPQEPAVGQSPAPHSSRQAELLRALGHGARSHRAGLLIWKLTTSERDLLGRGLGGPRGQELLRSVLAP